VEKLKNRDYNMRMTDRFEEFVLNGKQWSGQQISELIEDVYDDYNFYLKTRESPEITLYYRDLLAYLVKNYGH
jgi:hypothetical protein